MMTSSNRVAASFRDPSGFLFTRQGTLYRQVNRSYQEHYDRLMDSGLYESLSSRGLLIPHEKVDLPAEDPGDAYVIIRPEPLSFISYPFEWSFSELKDAALATLSIQKRALKAGLTLKDCSAYNIQFRQGRPVLIDTLSFEIYQEGQPWVAYRQFCQHFLAPLALMSNRDIRLGKLLQLYIDGIPLDLASTLLPRRTRLNFGLLTHIHLHASAQRRYAGEPVKETTRQRTISRTSFEGLVESLGNAVRKLHWTPAGTEWGDYYEASAGHYQEESLEHKEQIVRQFLERIRPDSLWDLGANTGRFSQIASGMGISTIAFDIDPAAVERNYLDCKSRKKALLLPLVSDLTSPSPSIGWENQERLSLIERGPAGCVMALALIHHLAISNNVPLDRLAGFFSRLAPWLIVEFIPKGDPQVQRLLASREDIFPNYEPDSFEAAFGEYFETRERIPIRQTQRCLYLMEAVHS
jgi:hypothetical protein